MSADLAIVDGGYGNFRVLFMRFFREAVVGDES